ncbi:MAG: MFS transporter [Actinobacteria bacterium]|nr:MFS transporter [Actinomycetota bacterium]MCL6104463.1 MFS transporter [Actinomycetota bacterium]
MSSPAEANWRSRDVWAISLSAFFADLGYQSVLAGLPLYMVISLHRSIALYGLAMALGYGGGSLIAYAGSKIGDKIGHRKLAIIGNSAIPLLSLSALFASPIAAIGFFCGGWWARNLRSPSRRVMLTQATNRKTRTRAFGFLHSLDIGGGMLAGVYMLAAIAVGISYRYVFLGTIIPLLISTGCLTVTSRHLEGMHKEPVKEPNARPTADLGEASDEEPASLNEQRLLPHRFAIAIFAATLLFGFSSYSIGFPVLTAAKASHNASLGLLAFLFFNGISAATGLIISRFPGLIGANWHAAFFNLGLAGYLPAAIGAALLGAAAGAGLGYGVVLLGIAMLGIALGIVETLEPSLMSIIRPGGGSGFGLLAAYRSTGLFIGNLVMGLLYTFGADWSYGYASVVALLGALILLVTSVIDRRNGLSASAAEVADSLAIQDETQDI